MKNYSDIIIAKLTARLAKVPPNSGHAKVLRAKLGISPVVDAPALPTPDPTPVATSKKKKAAKKKGGGFIDRWR